MTEPSIPFPHVAHSGDSFGLQFVVQGPREATGV